jgi:DNA-directed RNA polymerase specialized sigma24 family protein
MATERIKRPAADPEAIWLSAERTLALQQAIQRPPRDQRDAAALRFLGAAPAEDISIGRAVERVPVVALERHRRRLRVVLGRPTRKRCDVQIVEKRYKNPSRMAP